jgi:hypothetical protein
MSGGTAQATGSYLCLGAPADQADPYYSEPRVFVDAQSWWEDSAQPAKRHLHMGACIPERETLSGTIHIDAKVQMHDNLAGSKITYVAIVWETGASGDHTYFSRNPGWTCGSNQCSFWQGFDMPVSAFDRSGLEGIRLRATDREPSAKELRVSMNFQAYIENGKTRQDMTRMAYLRLKGWYTGLNYCESAYRSDVTPLPDGPVSGVWSPWLRQIDHGSTDADPTYHSIRLDPDLHNGIPGTFLNEGSGPRDGYFNIDTTGLMGTHKLMLETECETSAGQNSGVGVIPFTVG